MRNTWSINSTCVGLLIEKLQKHFPGNIAKHPAGFIPEFYQYSKAEKRKWEDIKFVQYFQRPKNYQKMSKIFGTPNYFQSNCRFSSAYFHEEGFILFLSNNVRNLCQRFLRCSLEGCDEKTFFFLFGLPGFKNWNW